MCSSHVKTCNFKYPYILSTSLSVIHNSQKLLTPLNESSYKSRNINNKRHKFITNLENNKNKTLKKVERNRLDLLINNAYDNHNYKIRTYNFYSRDNSHLKVERLPKITENELKERVIAKVNQLFPKRYKNLSQSKGLNKEEIQNEINKHQNQINSNNYKKIYRIKYIDTFPDEKFYYNKTVNTTIYKQKTNHASYINRHYSRDLIRKLNKIKKEEEEENKLNRFL